MTKSSKFLSLLLAVLLAFGAIGLQANRPVQAANTIRISQVYGGGGNSGSYYKTDFIELYNSGDSPVNLDGWSVQYASNTGTSWQVTALTGIIPAHGYYLIAEASGTGGTEPLPTPDDTGTIAMGATAFKVALANSTSALTGACPTSNSALVDFLGTGSANCYEGTGTAPAASNTLSATRKQAGCTDTDDNKLDFESIAPNPRNKTSPAHYCTLPAPTVASASPANNATDVAIDANIVITFDRAVTVSEGWYSIVCGTTTHNATITDANPVFTLNPDTDFANGTSCTVTLDASKVLNGTTPMATNYVFSFSTVATPSTAPTVSSTSPANNATAVAIDSDITITFNQALTVSEGWYSIVCGATTHTATVTDANPVFTLNPDTDFAAGQSCTVSLDASKISNGSEFMASDYVFSFSTVADPAIAPSVSSTSPANNATDVAINSNVTITFSQAVTVSEGWYNIVCGGATYTATVTDANPVFTLNPVVDFPNGQNCTVTLDATKILNGTTPMAANYVFSFTTVDTAPRVTAVSPANAATNVPVSTTAITVTFSEAVTVAATAPTLSCTRAGNLALTGTPNATNTVYTFAITGSLLGTDSCNFTLAADGVTDNDIIDPPDAMESNFTSSFSTEVRCGDPFTPTYAIQGTGAASPLVGQNIITEGVVVGDFQVGGKKGFFIQDATGDDDPNTSDGLFVYYPTAPEVNLGDKVRINGKISEYYNLTQLTGAGILICSTGNTVQPTPLTLPFTSADHERYEGMLVSFAQPLVISEYFNYDRYGEILLTSARHYTFTATNAPCVEGYANFVINHRLDSIAVDDGSTTQNPAFLRHPDGGQFTQEHYFRGGDTVSNLVGIMDYANNAFKLQPVGTASYSPVNTRTVAPELVAGEIRVASLNVLNYFVTIDDGSNNCGPSGDMNCRGADSILEFTRQRTKTVAAIKGLAADVIGLIEIENDRPGPAPDYAVADLVSALNTELGPGTYAYIATGALGTDAIKQAFIYKPARVSPVGSFAALTAAIDPRFDTTKHRPALTQTFKDLGTNEIFTVSINHLKSKGSTCTGDPDLNNGAGNCNITRTTGAQALVEWLSNDPTNSGSEMFLIIGDLNSYAMEDPIQAIQKGKDGQADSADDFVNLVTRFRQQSGYGYVYDGQVGYLDHALANRRLASYVLDANFWHINADESDVFDYNTDYRPAEQIALYQPNAYRSSDHDPVLISLLLNHKPVAVDDSYETPKNTTLTIAAPGVLANDSDLNIYDQISVSLVEDSGPQHGSLTLNADGSFSYTPATNYVGADSFQYTMHALPGLMDDNYSSVATVTITVTGSNDAPVAVADMYETNYETLLTVTAEAGVLSNDSDADHDALTAVLVDNVDHGMLTFNADGSFTYQPETGFTGVVRFTYYATDQAKNSETVTVSITVRPAKVYLPLIFR